MSLLALNATYFDGRSTQSAAVVLRVHLAAGHLELEGLPTALHVPLAHVRVSPRLGNTARVLSLPSGAHCESSDHAELDALQRQQGTGGGARLLHRLESSWSARLLALALIAGMLYGAVTWVIPSAAVALAQSTPAQVAHHVGKGVLGLLDKIYFWPTQLSPSRQAKLQEAFQPLAQAYPELPLRLIFRRMGQLNALALPDGTVVLSDELVHAARRDEQLVGVMAHEVGHVHHRHALRKWLAGSSATLLLAVYMSDLAQLGDWTALLPTKLFAAGFSRQQEMEADEFALAYLQRAGISPTHLADMFGIFAKLGAQPGALGQYLSSHPLTSERIRRIESFAAAGALERRR